MKEFIKVKASNVSAGDRVYSPLLGECFTVKRAQRHGNYMIFRDGIYSMKRHMTDLVTVEITRDV